ncbi:MAG: RCC1 repeat-containing protein [Acidimicrobiales bacterium]|nr:RCC1 repeat-containing protein [Acidimicrobiales bacterium]
MFPVQVVGAGGVGVLTGVSSITGGDRFTCAVLVDGTVWCWGLNAYGQLGSKVADSPSPVQVVGPGAIGTLSGVNEAAAGESHVCAVRGDTSVWCWGRNDQGQLGDNATATMPNPVPVLGAGGIGTLTGAQSVATGQKHTCVTTADGSSWCWGQNADGQLGDNTTTDSGVPVQVVGIGGNGFLSGSTLAGAGELFSCAARSDWTAVCWGRNNRGQLGDNTTTDSSIPVQIKGGGWTGVFADATVTAAGDDHSCAVRLDGSAWCWGQNDKGQLGDDTTSDSLVPVPVRGPGGVSLLTGVSTVSAGAKYTCALKIDGTVWCWGQNSQGQLGDNTTADSSSPVQVVGPGGSGTLTGVNEVSAGDEFTCAGLSDGTVWCWGRNDKGQLGDNTTTDSSAPVQVTDVGGVGTLTGITSIGTGLKHACGMKSDGTAWCWGQNNVGQLGDTTTTDSSSPVAVAGPGGVGTFSGAKIAGFGALHSCVVRTDATAWCWGDNSKGQLGDNTTTDSAWPVQVVGTGGIGSLSLVLRIDGGAAHTCAQDTADRIWCWGENDQGQLGDNTKTDSSFPVSVTGPGGVGIIGDALNVGVALKHGCVVRADRSVWCWGDNPQGQLGDGTKTDSASPVQVL